MDINPLTSQPWPSNTLHRILHITPKVHIYLIPPAGPGSLTARSWTLNPADHIFTARLRILESAVGESLSLTILLEDPSTGALFAAAPYTSPAAVTQATDSSRFFAVRVVGEGGRRATLGVGFEERSEAFDFGVVLQDARRGMGMDAPAGAPAAGARGRRAPKKEEPEVKRDFRLKEGETITVSIGGKGKREAEPAAEGAAGGGLFAIAPPPGSAGASGGGMPVLAPPPSAAQVRAGRREGGAKSAAEELGFDDGEFGEFQ
ncbi:adaptin ear-binding coat-associated protein 1 NECAP-1 [Trichodelitschia bisporula]|uniref:Adaptin ear-binding coat-associated protein 1 NECAP-1 n=1 Tax=Trichodelitschia bisporula TaxID=703511 RepID=A0A6G1HL41_9PEZI|nr:adaptin ear-binding coat-associated protein 1 NECAP-1 [Trichodelitschia bisporula]